MPGTAVEASAAPPSGGSKARNLLDTHSGSSQPTGQVMDDGGVVQIEGGVCPSVADDLSRRGHKVYRGANGGGYQAIMFDHRTNSFIGATEMRKDGIAAGY